MVEDKDSSGSLTDLFQALAAPLTESGLASIPTWGAQIALETLLEHVRARLVGRRVDVETAHGTLAFTLCGLGAQLDSIAATAGQADDVSVSARDVEFRGFDLAEVTATLGNVHTRIGARPAVVCAPIDLRVSLTNEQVSQILARFSPRSVATCTETGCVRLRSRRNAAGWLDAVPEVVRGQLTLRPVAVGRKRWSLRFGGRIAARPVPVALPPIARLTGIDVQADALSVDIRVDQWRVEYSQILGLGR